jgi:thioredoxin 1
MRRMNPDTVDVACLCAAWCDLCDAYAPVFEQACSELAASGVALRRHWIDIEDDAALVGDFDVQTFPTIVIADADQVRFAGPIMPQPDTLRRLLRATIGEAHAGARWPDANSEAIALAARLRERPGAA